MMDSKVESEILFHIESKLSDREVDSRQLLNQVRPVSDGFLLRCYGLTLRFNSDGDLL